MAKKTYIGVGDVARQVGKIYIGVGGVARKVKKAYIGVNGVAYPCFGGSVPVYYAASPSSTTSTTRTFNDIPFRADGFILFNQGAGTSETSVINIVYVDGGTTQFVYKSGRTSTATNPQLIVPTIADTSITVTTTNTGSFTFTNSPAYRLIAWDENKTHTTGDITLQADSKIVTVSGLPFTPSGAIVYSSALKGSGFSANQLVFATATTDGSIGAYGTSGNSSGVATATVSGNSITIDASPAAQAFKAAFMHYVAWE